LRAGNAALGSGDFVPLATGQDGVAAYLRSKDQKHVVVVANLASSRATGVALNSAASALPPGHYVARSLLGNSGATTFSVNGTGAISKWIPVPGLESLSVHIIEISKQN
jgi:hypothetical protein